MRFTHFALGVVALYSLIEWRGINFLPARRHAVIPVVSTVRSSPGGYRSYHSTGSSGTSFHGGK